MIAVRKMDEMEMSVNLRAIKCAWFYTIIFLTVWLIYNFIQTGDTGVPGFLLVTQNLVLFAVEFFLKRKLGRDEK